MLSISTNHTDVKHELAWENYELVYNQMQEARGKADIPYSTFPNEKKIAADQIDEHNDDAPPAYYQSPW
jgi:hypothetical protein